MALTNQPRLAMRLRMSVAIPLLHFCAFVTRYRVNFTLLCFTSLLIRTIHCSVQRHLFADDRTELLRALCSHTAVIRTYGSKSSWIRKSLHVSQAECSKQLVRLYAMNTTVYFVLHIVTFGAGRHVVCLVKPNFWKNI